jgi:hypothetical protein
MDEMITSAINNNKYNRSETKSPLEDVIKYWWFFNTIL